ncbi:MAG: FAD-binding protein [Thermoguttaceae bacterium]|nr:FAD-binding protein [Thermoguttaceae bacterium]MBR4750854.1 FAD-binding protein [Thermoguttaceae bacterium]MBR5758524.1 FAD-binding protein [Thermoguttaceae bacterium]
MGKIDKFHEIVRAGVPASELTWLRLGGPIEYYAVPRSESELVGLLQACASDGVEARALGDGASVLGSDVGAPGMAIRLSDEAFCNVEIDAPYVKAGAGVKLSRLATTTASAGLGGLECMAGIPGTVGAAVASNVTTPDAALEQYVESARVVTYAGEVVELSKDEIVFGRRSSNLSAAIVTSVTFKFESDLAEELAKRLQKIWIVRQKYHPELDKGGFARMFKDPRGQRAADLVEEIGLVGAGIGGAYVSEVDPNLVVAGPNCTSDDVKRLLALVEKQARERAQVELERELEIW